MSHMFAFASGVAGATILFVEGEGYKFLSLLVAAACAAVSTALTLAGAP